MQKKFNIADNYRFNSIRFIASLLYGLKDVIASENSVFEVLILDVAVLCENTDLKEARKGFFCWCSVC